MGKRIDHLILLTFLVSLFFFFLLGALRSIPLCMALSLLFGAAVLRLLRRLPEGARTRRRRLARQAEAYLDAVVLRRAGEAALLQALPPRAVVLYRLAGSALEREELLSLWRAQTEPLTLATTGSLPRSTADLAQSLQPPVALFGRGDLIRRLADDPKIILPEVPGTSRRGGLRARWHQALENNRLGVAGSCLYAAILLVLYLFTGSVVYLACALCLAALGGLSWRARRSG